jgi:prepilin-type N-terminal cleavage/methylation domain-containing protein
MYDDMTNAIRPASGERHCASVKAFTLLEVLAALAILALASSSVLFVINRCMASTANSAIRMEAFQVARENLEKVLVAESVSESVEYGTSELYPSISWRTVIEAFSEPVTGQMWVRAVCSADYIDATGETQTLELIHWIGTLTDQQAERLLDDEDLEALEAEQLVETVEDAADYAAVDVETIEDWVVNGLLMTAEGAFIRHNLDIYIQSGGDPSDSEKGRQVESIEELAMMMNGADQTGEGAPGVLEGANGVDPTTGLPYEQLEQMGVGEVMDVLRERQDRSR